MEHNNNLGCGKCICSFSFGVDRIHVFTMPDEQSGYVIGWLFCFNTVPYFYSIACGWDYFDTAISTTYAEYLASNGDHESVEPGIDGEGWVLNDDTDMEFHSVFCDAMMDAGYTQDEDGRWEKRPAVKRKRKLHNR